jgi:hypothetical protein
MGLIPGTKINSKWIVDLSVKLKITIKGNELSNH